MQGEDQCIHIKANFIGLKYDLKWHDPDICSRVVVINVIINVAVKRNMMFDEEYMIEVQL